MSMAYNCDSEDGNTAVLLVTDLVAGETLALCGACMPPWIAVMNHEMNPDGDPAATAAPTDPTTGDDSDEDADADNANHDTEPPTDPLPLGDTDEPIDAVGESVDATA